jgi:hypothetical protein
MKILLALVMADGAKNRGSHSRHFCDPLRGQMITARFIFTGIKLYLHTDLILCTVAYSIHLKGSNHALEIRPRAYR